ncbi:hypothetical protein Tco_1356547 [Tanacetum coccineum]
MTTSLIRVYTCLDLTIEMSYQGERRDEGLRLKEIEGPRRWEEIKLRAWSLYWSWMAAETPRVFRAKG